MVLNMRNTRHSSIKKYLVLLQSSLSDIFGCYVINLPVICNTHAYTFKLHPKASVSIGFAPCPISSSSIPYIILHNTQVSGPRGAI